MLPSSSYVVSNKILFAICYSQSAHILKKHAISQLVPPFPPVRPPARSPARPTPGLGVCSISCESCLLTAVAWVPT